MAVFFDTNVILYLLADDPAKKLRSEALLATGGVISAQVLNEFVAVARRLPRSIIPGRIASWAEIEIVLAGLPLTCRIVPLTATIHKAARRLAQSHRLHIYDASIVAAASEAGCATLLSEDLNDGQVIDGVTIRNPYAGLGP